MRVFFHLFFTLYFVLISSGIIYSKHTCGDHVSRSVFGISINPGGGCCCSHESAEHDDDCCESETQVFQAETQKFNTLGQFKIWMPLVLELHYTHTTEPNCLEFENPDSVSSISHPPPESPTPLYLLIKLLLI